MNQDHYLSCKESILSVLAEGGIAATCDKNWLITVMIDVPDMVPSYILSDEMPEWDRSQILSADSYMHYLDHPSKFFGIAEKGIVYYEFVDKIIDSNNNLLVIAVPNSIEITEHGELG